MSCFGQMKAPARLALAVASIILLLAGCGREPAASNGNTDGDAKAKAEEAKIRLNLEQLPPEDRKIAKEQKFCADKPANRLGSMGTPYKIVIDKETVFLCCKHCEEDAFANLKKTLAVAKELRKKNSTQD